MWTRSDTHIFKIGGVPDLQPQNEDSNLEQQRCVNPGTFHPVKPRTRSEAMATQTCSVDSERPQYCDSSCKPKKNQIKTNRIKTKQTKSNQTEAQQTKNRNKAHQTPHQHQSKTTQNKPNKTSPPTNQTKRKQAKASLRTQPKTKQIKTNQTEPD